MIRPIITANSPACVELKSGKTYAFCTCGLSENQPFCDGKHGGTGLIPHVFKAEKEETAWLCRCKATSSAPFCDGSHSSFADDQIGQSIP